MTFICKEQPDVHYTIANRSLELHLKGLRFVIDLPGYFVSARFLASVDMLSVVYRVGEHLDILRVECDAILNHRFARVFVWESIGATSGLRYLPKQQSFDSELARMR